MAKQIFISGADGFIGSHLTPFLAHQQHVLHTNTFELRNRETWKVFLDQPHLDVFIHMAGLSSQPACEKDPELATQINTQATLDLACELQLRHPGVHFIFPSTAHVYEINETTPQPLTEESRIHPRSMYAKTKFAAEVGLKELCDRTQMGISILRLFNHTHKSQSTDFFLPSLYRQLLSEKIIRVGNLQLTRDFSPIGDLLAAISAVLEAPLRGLNVFNVCSGQPRRLDLIAQELMRQMGVACEFVVDPDRLRKNDPLEVYGSCAKLINATGFHPSQLSDSQFIQRFLADQIL